MTLAEMAHHAEVVRDEHEGEAAALPQLLEQHQDLRLHADVERRDRLVGEDEVWTERESAGDTDALALAARELVRKASRRRGRQPDLVEEARDRTLDLLALRDAVHADRLSERVGDALARIERGGRIRKRSAGGGARSATRKHPPPDVDPVEAHVAGIGRDKAEAGAGDRRLAAAGFADDAERLPRSTMNDTPSSARTDTVFGTGQPRFALNVLASSRTTSRGSFAADELTAPSPSSGPGASGAPGSGLSGGRSAHFSMRKGQRDW